MDRSDARLLHTSPAGKRYLHEYVIPPLPENEPVISGDIKTVELHDEVEIVFPHWEPDATFYRELTPVEQEDFRVRNRHLHQRFIVVSIEGGVATLMTFSRTRSYSECYPDAPHPELVDWEGGRMQYDASKIRREPIEHLLLVVKNHQKPEDFQAS